MAVSLLALCAGCSLPPGGFLVLISVRGWVEPRAIVQLEGLAGGQFQWTVTNLSVKFPELKIFLSEVLNHSL
jgi:hypothetical protein